MRELSMEEVGQVNGGMILDAAPFFTAMITIGATTFGSTWGAVAVGTAVAVAPFAVGGDGWFVGAGRRRIDVQVRR